MSVLDMIFRLRHVFYHKISYMPTEDAPINKS